MDDYQTSFVRKTIVHWEVFVKTSIGVKFGLQIQTHQEHSRDDILEIFKNHFNNFFIELEEPILLLTDKN